MSLTFGYSGQIQYYHNSLKSGDPSLYTEDWGKIIDYIPNSNYVTVCDTNQVGFDTSSGKCVWNPTSQRENCSPYFMIYPYIYFQKKGLAGHYFFPSQSTTVPKFNSIKDTETQEIKLYWSGQILFNGLNARYSSSLITNSGLPNSLKTYIKLPEDYEDFGFYYVFRRSDAYDYGDLKFLITVISSKSP